MSAERDPKPDPALRAEWHAGAALDRARLFFARLASHENLVALERAERRYVAACARRRGLVAS